MMEKTRYSVEIYAPGGATPFGAWPSTEPVHMAVGDVLHMAALLPSEPPFRVKVAQVEHALWMRDGLLAHKLMVFTEPE